MRALILRRVNCLEAGSGGQYSSAVPKIEMCFGSPVFLRRNGHPHQELDPEGCGGQNTLLNAMLIQASCPLCSVEWKIFSITRASPNLPVGPRLARSMQVVLVSSSSALGPPLLPLSMAAQRNFLCWWYHRIFLPEFLALH